MESLQDALSIQTYEAMTLLGTATLLDFMI